MTTTLAWSCHRSVDPSVLTILPPGVRSTTTTSAIFQFIPELRWEKDEDKHKAAGIVPFFKKTTTALAATATTVALTTVLPLFHFLSSRLGKRLSASTHNQIDSNPRFCAHFLVIIITTIAITMDKVMLRMSRNKVNPVTQWDTVRDIWCTKTKRVLNPPPQTSRAK